MDMILRAIYETSLMVFFSSILGSILGFPLGLVLFITDKESLRKNKPLNRVLNGLINILRSIPFIILIIFLFPLSKLVLKTTIGTRATIIPLSIAAMPFVARLVESSLNELDSDLIELGVAMGASVSDIVFKILIPEAMPSLVSGLTLTIVNLIGLSAMAGAVGGGGLGDLAMRYGYHRFQMDIMLLSVLAIVLLVQLVEFIGRKILKKIDKN